MKSPRISVVIPSYNKVSYIKQTLDSIFLQNYPNLEVIIQDGGSTDGTLDVIKRYGSKISFLESKKDNGQLDAINKGFEKATGDILTFINADDYYTRDTFILVSKSFKKKPEALWFAGQGKVVNENGIEIAKVVTEYKNLLLLLNNKFFILVTNYLIQPAVFITKDAYNKFGPFTGTKDFVMEYGLWLKLAKVQMPVVINNTLASFRIEHTTKTMRMFDQILSEDEKLLKKYTNNIVIRFLHSLHNLARKIIGRFV